MSDQQSSPRRLILLTVVLVLCGGVWYFDLAGVRRLSRETVQPLSPDEIQALFDDGRFLEAEQEAAKRAELGDARFFLLAADAASKSGDAGKARAYWSKFDGLGGTLEAAAKLGIANSLYEAGRLMQARPVYEEALAIEPNLTAAHRGLVYLYAMSGMAYEVGPHTYALLRSGDHFLEAVALLADADAVLDPPKDIVGEPAETDPMILVGFTRRARKTEGLDKATEFMNQVAQRNLKPENAYTELGMLWEEDPARLRTWLLNADASCRNVPDFWYLAGRLAEYEELYAEACWCYQQCLDLHYDHLRATYALAQAAGKLGEDEAVSLLSARSELLHEMASRAQRAFVYRDNPGWPKRLAEISEALGRYWEAVAWGEIALQLEPTDRALRELMRRCLPQLSPSLPLHDENRSKRRELVLGFAKAWEPPTSGSANPAVAYQALEQEMQGDAIGQSSIRFRDDTEAAGLVFSYIDTADVENVGRRMHEFTGTGVAAIDYDGDLRPDLFFPQSSTLPPGSDFQTDLPDGDQLFRRSVVGERYVNATDQACVVAPGFGQGVAAGDFDGDGFQDLYIGQVGRNRLLINNGDGTYRDATDESKLAATSWTTSVAITDLDGDGHADLFDVNYLGGPEVYTRTCSDGDQFISCSPLGFPGEPDAVFSGTGEGRVHDVTAEWGFETRALNGLGLVVGKFDGDATLDVFVANDLTENHFFVNSGQPESPQFADEALFRGIALNRHAETEACMGIAVGDVDQDGQQDLFVTNFLDESNTLYRSHSDGTYSDDTAAFHLVNDGIRLMGFGTQFLDMDLDGYEDLVISNGHVDKQPGKKFAMEPLAYRHNGNTFDRIPNSTLGSYFMEEFVGRGLVRLDWNSDGRDEFVTTHLTSPVRLVTNVSDQTTHVLRLSIRGTTTHRDAIGAKIFCELTKDGDEANRTLTRQLTAGDGYMASNERVLTFGILPNEEISRLRVEWPSGRIDRFDSVTVDRHYIAVEGIERLVDLPGVRF